MLMKLPCGCVFDGLCLDSLELVVAVLADEALNLRLQDQPQGLQGTFVLAAHWSLIRKGQKLDRRLEVLDVGCQMLQLTVLVVVT